MLTHLAPFGFPEVARFRCDVRPERRVVVVKPVGELDIATEPLLEAQLRELHDVSVDHLVVDLRGLEFMDSTGLALLLRWTLSAEETGSRFSVIPGSPAVHRVLEISGVNARLHFVTEAQLRAGSE